MRAERSADETCGGLKVKEQSAEIQRSKINCLSSKITKLTIAEEGEGDASRAEETASAVVASSDMAGMGR